MDEFGYDDDTSDKMEVDFPGQLHGAALQLDEMLAARTQAALQLGDGSSEADSTLDDARGSSEAST